jgi:group I intron endonuclease
MHSIYKIENIINGKKYIGRTNNADRRKSEHLSALKYGKHRNVYLQKAWEKYGEHNFIFDVVDESENINEIFEKEQEWIANLKTCDRKYGYNLTEGGEKSILSEESLKKLSASLKGRIITQESKDRKRATVMKKYENGFKGNISNLRPHKKGEFHHSEESKKKMSDYRTGKKYKEIYGDEKAEEIKNEKRLSSLGEKNPNFKHLDAEKIKRLIDDGKLVKEIKKILSATYNTISNRFKDTYGISISQYTDSIGLTKNGSRVTRNSKNK